MRVLNFDGGVRGGVNYSKNKFVHAIIFKLSPFNILENALDLKCKFSTPSCPHFGCRTRQYKFGQSERKTRPPNEQSKPAIRLPT